MASLDGRDLDLTPTEFDLLAVLVQNPGRVFTREALLNADRSLTAEEFEIIKKHPFWGADVARKANLSDVVQNIVLYHHERYDGKGYPTGLKGNDIPLEARIVAVADVYDALLTERPTSWGVVGPRSRYRKWLFVIK